MSRHGHLAPIGAITDKEAGTNLGPELFIGAAALTAWPSQPGIDIEATLRDTVSELLHRSAQLRRMHAKVLRRPHIGYASILNQADRFQLELSGSGSIKAPNSVSSKPRAGHVVFKNLSLSSPPCAGLWAKRWKAARQNITAVRPLSSRLMGPFKK
jgi:hypothetical protein